MDYNAAFTGLVARLYQLHGGAPDENFALPTDQMLTDFLTTGSNSTSVVVQLPHLAQTAMETVRRISTSTSQALPQTMPLTSLT